MADAPDEPCALAAHVYAPRAIVMVKPHACRRCTTRRRPSRDHVVLLVPWHDAEWICTNCGTSNLRQRESVRRRAKSKTRALACLPHAIPEAEAMAKLEEAYG